MPAATDSLRSSITRGRGFESLGDELRSRFSANVENIGPELRRFRNAAGSAVQQKFRSGGGSFARNLEQTVRRGKARQGISGRGESAVRNQQLKNRIALARQTIARRGQTQQASANAARLRAGLETERRSAKDQVNQAKFGAAGAIAGGAIRGFSGFFDKPGEVPLAMDQGTAAADFFNDFNLDDFELENVGSGLGVPMNA